MKPDHLKQFKETTIYWIRKFFYINMQSLTIFTNFTIRPFVALKCSLPHMAEAVILGVIHKLETSLVEMPSTTSYSIHINQILKEVTDELRMLLDVSRDNRLGEGSRLNYLAADVVEITSELCTLSNIESTRDWLRETRMQMINLGVKWESLMINSSENLGKDEDEEDVVGLEEDVDVLLRRAILNKEEEGLSSLLVKGMAGIGKTTLARQVYNHAAVERRAWLRLSSDLTNKEALMKLIQQVVGSEELQRDSLLEKMEHADNPSLQQMLHQHLQGMSYFIVLDNLPKPTHCLNSILRGLPDEGMIFTQFSILYPKSNM